MRALLLRLNRSTLATRTATAISVLFLTAILAVGMASMHSFRTQLMNVMVAEQNTLVERIADNVDQKLRSLQRILSLSASEITDADMATPEAAQRYLDHNTGLYAAADRAEVVRVRLAGHASDRDGAASPEWANEAPFHTTVRFGIDLLSLNDETRTEDEGAGTKKI